MLKNNLLKTVEKGLFIWFGHLKKINDDTIVNIMLEYNAEGGKPREQGMNEE